MDTQEYKVLEYVDNKGKDQTLSFKCNTPHVLITGDNIDDILSLEKKMLKNLSDSNGKEINLVIIDDFLVLPEEYFSDLKFNYIKRMTEEEVISSFKDSPRKAFPDRYGLMARNEVGSFTQLNESGREHLKMLVYFFAFLSENQDIYEALNLAGTAMQAGVHIIAGVTKKNEINYLIDGCESKFSFPSYDDFRDVGFFYKSADELPKSGELWFKYGCNGDVKPITLK